MHSRCYHARAESGVSTETWNEPKKRHRVYAGPELGQSVRRSSTEAATLPTVAPKMGAACKIVVTCLAWKTRFLAPTKKQDIYRGSQVELKSSTVEARRSK